MAAGVKFYSVSLVGLVKEFNAFYKEGMDWLRMFSERCRAKVANNPRNGRRPPGD